MCNTKNYTYGTRAMMRRKKKNRLGNCNKKIEDNPRKQSSVHDQLTKKCMKGARNHWHGNGTAIYTNNCYQSRSKIIYNNSQMMQLIVNNKVNKQDQAAQCTKSRTKITRQLEKTSL